jgi:hypothetical protein
MHPKIFVGTLHSNEGDFTKCCETIRTQTDVTVTHHIIAGLNEKDAHNVLWNAWNQAKSSHDFFVKVDADTKLASLTTLSKIAQQFYANASATSLQAPLHDYMTDQLITGLNAYTPNVHFAESLDDLYCDRGMDNNNTKTIRENLLWPELVPAGYHCHHATNLQGFRYGVHRAMKTQNAEIQRLIWTWKKFGDHVRGLGVIGSLLAPKLAKNRAIDYTNTNFVAAFEDAERRYDEYVAAINARRFEVFD